MSAIVHALAVLAAVCILLPSLLFLLEVVAARLGSATSAEWVGSESSAVPSTAIVMPAHNEAAGIEDTIRNLLPQLNGSTRLLVIADNCTDNTHELVQAFAEHNPCITVLSRQDTLRRGKGYALHHGMEHLAANPPEVVVILDADCKISEGGVATLAAQCQRLGRPVQALYLMHNPPQNKGVASRLAEFAWVVKNQVRALGGRVLGVPCPLMGTGMAFGWVQISGAQLATGHLVEDMQLGVELTMSGTPAVFSSAVRVTSEFPISDEGQQSQRTRWEHGHLSVILSEVPKLLRQGLKQGSFTLLLGALDVAIPPMALLAMLAGASFGTGLALWAWSGQALAMYLSGLAVASILAGAGIAWSGFGRHTITLRELGFIPLYVIRKIPLYFFFLFKRQTTWVRSKREGEK